MTKKTLTVIGIIVCIILVSGIAVLTRNKQSKTSVAPVKTTEAISTPIPEQPSASPTAHIVVTPKTTSTSVQYSAEFKAKARSTFMANCIAKYGKEYESNCTCGANYLSAHYTDAELTDVYMKFHSSSQVPKEIQAAYDSCKQ